MVSSRHHILYIFLWILPINDLSAVISNHLQVITPGGNSVGSHNLLDWRHLLQCWGITIWQRSSYSCMGHQRTLTFGLGRWQSPLWLEAELGRSWLVSLAPSSGTFVMGTGKRWAGYSKPKGQRETAVSADFSMQIWKLFQLFVAFFFSLLLQMFLLPGWMMVEILG